MDLYLVASRGGWAVQDADGEDMHWEPEWALACAWADHVLGESGLYPQTVHYR